MLVTFTISVKYYKMLNVNISVGSTYYLLWAGRIYNCGNQYSTLHWSVEDKNTWYGLTCLLTCVYFLLSLHRTPVQDQPNQNFYTRGTFDNSPEDSWNHSKLKPSLDLKIS